MFHLINHIRFTKHLICLLLLDQFVMIAWILSESLYTFRLKYFDDIIENQSDKTTQWFNVKCYDC